ncbi:MAG: class I SAM-dependent methyltransferase [Oligoflexia bacterium]|nr:class I SAM-dependent methyltransferase [Oligoflexia bacterium]
MSSVLSKSDKELTLRWFRDLELGLSDSQSLDLIGLSIDFWKIFEQKNKLLNLSANRDFSSWYWKNYMDSLIAGAFLKEESFLDWGTGGGFPVIPLSQLQKVLGTEKKLICVDSVAKKIAAVNEFCSSLSLPVAGYVGRGEQLLKSSPWKFQISSVTVRAVAAPEKMIPWMRKVQVESWFLYLGPNQLMLWQSYEEKLREMGFFLTVEKNINLPLNMGSRILLLIKK